MLCCDVGVHFVACYRFLLRFVLSRIAMFAIQLLCFSSQLHHCSQALESVLSRLMCRVLPD
jgi:hypothetical protein